MKIDTALYNNEKRIQYLAVTSWNISCFLSPIRCSLFPPQDEPWDVGPLSLLSC